MIEVLIAMFILTVIGVAFLVTLNYALKANILDDANSTAESLARTQMESIKKETYLYFNTSSPSAKRPNETYAVLPVPTDYQITVTIEPINAVGTPYPLVLPAPYTYDIYAADSGIQKVTILVEFNLGGNPNIWDASVMVEGYKVDR